MSSDFKIKKFTVLQGGAGKGGGGPEDPMLEERVGRLEEKFDRIEAIVTRIDGMVNQILATGAKQSGDLQKLQTDVAEIKVTGAKQADLNKLQVEVAEIKGGSAKQADLTRVQADIGEIRGRLAGIEGRFSQIPTVWGMLGIIATLLIGLAGLMFTAGKFLHP